MTLKICFDVYVTLLPLFYLFHLTRLPYFLLKCTESLYVKSMLCHKKKLEGTP